LSKARAPASVQLSRLDEALACRGPFDQQWSLRHAADPSP